MENRYRELKKAFLTLNTKKAKIISLLVMARMWKPLVIASRERIWEVPQKIKECLEILWRNTFQEVKSSELKKLHGILNDIDNLYVRDEEGGFKPQYVFDTFIFEAICDSSNWFFSKDTCSNENGFVVIEYMLDMLEYYIEAFTSDDIENNTIILEEMDRIIKDINMVEKKAVDEKNICQLWTNYENMEVLVGVNEL